MSFCITTNEPITIKALPWKDDCLQVPMDFDFMLFTKSGIIGLERKAIPDDLISSLFDGRLSREIQAMREQCDICILIKHGKYTFHRDGSLKCHQGNWTREGLKNFERTIQYVEGLYIEEAEDDLALVDLIHNLQTYFDQTNHFSLKTRPGIQADWIVPSHEERLRYFYQGLPGFSTVRAKNLAQKYPNPCDLFKASVDDLMTIHGIGKVLATKAYEFMHGANGKDV